MHPSSVLNDYPAKLLNRYDKKHENVKKNMRVFFFFIPEWCNFKLIKCQYVKRYFIGIADI